jgi:hypothetical protein
LTAKTKTNCRIFSGLVRDACAQHGLEYGIWLTLWHNDVLAQQLGGTRLHDQWRQQWRRRWFGFNSVGELMRFVGNYSTTCFECVQWTQWRLRALFSGLVQKRNDA